MIALFIIAWVICAGITCGGMIHFCPDEWGDDPVFCMGICLMVWPVFVFMGIGHIVLKRLSKIGMFFAGFLDKAFEKEESDFGKDTNVLTNDCISRQAAMSLAKDICVPTKDGSVYRHRCINPDDILELPSAQPKMVCVANVTLTEEQVQEVFEKAKRSVLSVIEPEKTNSQKSYTAGNASTDQHVTRMEN